MTANSTIAGGVSTTRVAHRASDALDPTTRIALLKLTTVAIEAHPDSPALPDEDADEPKPTPAQLDVREIVAALGYAPQRAKKTGHCTSCDRERSIADVSPHTANPAGLCTACRRAAAKTTPTTSTKEA